MTLVFSLDYESDEDTEQLLNKQYKDEKVVEIPELKEEARYQVIHLFVLARLTKEV